MIVMQKLTPWFNAKLHLPAREGWYDCKECKTRHYFKDGLWYRDQKSLKDGHMTINKMHWRGLSAAFSPAYGRDDGPLTVKQIATLRKDAEKQLPKGKTNRLASQLALYDPAAPRSEEELAWENMAPVGWEFGSPNFERLMEEDARRDVKELKGMFGPAQKNVSIESMNASEVWLPEVFVRAFGSREQIKPQWIDGLRGALMDLDVGIALLEAEKIIKKKAEGEKWSALRVYKALIIP